MKTPHTLSASSIICKPPYKSAKLLSDDIHDVSDTLVNMGYRIILNLGEWDDHMFFRKENEVIECSKGNLHYYH